MHPYLEFVNPYLGDLLDRINLNKRFVKGEGCYLYDADGRQYLDFVAAYGALPFGFNPPEIWAALNRVQTVGEPSFCQPSFLEGAGDLAKKLIEMAPEGLKYVTFANSGTEAVEASIKMARSATGRRGILSTGNAFHGKTMAALSATHKDSYQDAFFAPLPDFHKIPYGDAEALEKAFADAPDYFAAFLVEPIQGEGGIVVPPAGYLQRVRELCTQYGVIFVLDEIQTGLGRTGDLFVCTKEDEAVPDILVLAKALGGGLMPIGAALANDTAYNEAFADKHSSTFAGNTLATRAGLASMELISRDDYALVKHVKETGEYLRQGLLQLAERYPQIIRSIRGRGFMLGVEFGVKRDDFWNSMLGIVAEQESLTPLIASYLLNVEGVRVAPTLSGADVIRVEPPLIATKEQCDVVIGAFERLLDVLATGNTAEFVRHLLGVEKRPVPPNWSLEVKHPVAPIGTEARFAFLVHPVDLKNYYEFDGSLAAFSEEELAGLISRWNDLVEPFVAGTTRLISADGSMAYGEFIAVPRTADEFLAMPRAQAVAEVEKAVQLAHKRGAQVVGLGAFTSVVTMGGLSLIRETKVPLTTGNSYTVVSATEAVYEAVTRLGTSLAEATMAVVGATGSIGRAVSLLLAEELPRLILIGNPARPEAARRRLLSVADEIVDHLRTRSDFAPGTIGARLASLGDLSSREAVLALEEQGALVLTTDGNRYLPEADVVVSATNTVGELITAANVKTGAVVCDLSRPANVSREIQEKRPDVLVIDGGIVAVPGRPDLGWNFGFEQGLAYACMAETMLLALDRHFANTSIGSDLNLEMIDQLREMASRHGFSLAQLRSFDRPLSDDEWERVLAARSEALMASIGD